MKQAFLLLIFCLSAANAVLDSGQAGFLRSWRSEISFLDQNGLSINPAAIWDINADPCSWTGVTCSADTPQRLIEIKLNPSIQNGLVHGAWPKLDDWEFSGSFPDVAVMNFTQVRLGPFLPNWINDFWGIDAPTNLKIVVTSTLSTVVCSENYRSFAFGDDLWCSNLNVVSQDKLFGPSVGGTLVTLQLSGFARYDQIYCSFALFNEENNATYKVLPESWSIASYRWTSIDKPFEGPDLNTQAQPVFLWRTNVTCRAPPHPPGEVRLNLQWFYNNDFFNITSYARSYFYECPPGTFNRTVGVCEACPPGFFSAGGTATACTRCPAGSYNSKNGSSTCDLCPRGTFSTVLGARNDSVCTPCPYATFNDKFGQSNCTDCPAGTYTLDTGATACPACPAGSFSNVTRSENCTKCPPGSFQPYPGSTSCFFCPQATYANRTGATACTPCPPGETTQSRGSLSCDFQCPAGTYRPSTVTRCISCAPGRFGATPGLALCSLCPVGTYSSNSSSTECIKCPPDTVTIRAGQSLCQRINRVQQPAERNGLVIGLVFIVLGVILIAIAVVYIIYKRRQQKKVKEEIELLKTEIGRLEKANGDDVPDNEYDSS